MFRAGIMRTKKEKAACGMNITYSPGVNVLKPESGVKSMSRVFLLFLS